MTPDPAYLPQLFCNKIPSIPFPLSDTIPAADGPGASARRRAFPLFDVKIETDRVGSRLLHQATSGGNQTYARPQRRSPRSQGMMPFFMFFLFFFTFSPAQFRLIVIISA